LLHTPIFVAAYPSINRCIPLDYYCSSRYVFIWFIIVFPTIYATFPTIYCYISYVFFLHSPWYIAAFSTINRCFFFNLWLHSQLINGTFHIVYLCISIFSCCIIPHDILLYFQIFISVFPMIYCWIAFDLLLYSLRIIAA